MWLSVVRRTVGSFSWLNGVTVIRKGTIKSSQALGIRELAKKCKSIHLLCAVVNARSEKLSSIRIQDKRAGAGTQLGIAKTCGPAKRNRRKKYIGRP